MIYPHEACIFHIPINGEASEQSSITAPALRIHRVTNKQHNFGSARANIINARMPHVDSYINMMSLMANKDKFPSPLGGVFHNFHSLLIIAGPRCNLAISLS